MPAGDGQGESKGTSTLHPRQAVILVLPRLGGRHHSHPLWPLYSGLLCYRSIACTLSHNPNKVLV